MKAYAILDGGGVKGAALAGCLKAAQEVGVDFAGYGGTSAGSIVALLASIGYTPDELLGIMCEELNFSDLLDDNGSALGLWGAAIENISQQHSRFRAFKVWRQWWSCRKRLNQLLHQKGIYAGTNIENKLRSLIVRKHRCLENRDEITFADLRNQGCKPLKVVASNLAIRRSVALSDAADSPIKNVLAAVRASCSYPLLFTPVMLHRAPLVDGGLSSNLPVWLFDEEREREPTPVVAFDLVTRHDHTVTQEYSSTAFIRDMLETALESGDALLRRSSNGLLHIEVPIGADIRTLDFNISTEKRRHIYNDGYRETLSFFVKRFGHPGDRLKDPTGQLEAVYGDSSVFRTVLAGFVQEVENAFPQSGNLRCHVMLPYGSEEEAVIVYSHRMDGDPDIDLRLDRTAGPPGDAVSCKQPVIADWRVVRSNPAASKMTRGQINKVPTSRQAIASAPVFDLRRVPIVENEVMTNLKLVGILSIDSDRSAAETGWGGADGTPSVAFIDILKRWADVVGKAIN